MAKVGGEKEKKAFLGFRLNVPVINLISDSEFTSFCVQGTRTQPLNCFGCSVHYRMSCTCAINKEVFSRLHSSSTHICLAKSLKSTHSTKLMKKLYWREHTHSTGGFDDSLETCARCSLSEPLLKYNSLCSSVVLGLEYKHKLRRLTSERFHFIVHFSNCLHEEVCRHSN